MVGFEWGIKCCHKGVEIHGATFANYALVEEQDEVESKSSCNDNSSDDVQDHLLPDVTPLTRIEQPDGIGCSVIVDITQGGEGKERKYLPTQLLVGQNNEGGQSVQWVEIVLVEEIRHSNALTH